MKELNSTCLTQVARSKARSRSLPFTQLVFGLCLVCTLLGVGCLFDRSLLVSAARKTPEPAFKNVPEVDSARHVFARTDLSEDRLWTETKKGTTTAKVEAAPRFYRTLSLNESAQREVLRRAPMEFTKAARSARAVITLPLPDGTFGRFRIEESPMLAPELAARFPEIRTYRGRGIDDPTTTTRFDVTPAGLHAIVLTTGGTFIIEPAAQERSGQYVSYNQREAPASSSCLLVGAEQALAQPPGKQLPRNVNANPSIVSEPTLRTFRLAIAATAEFTQTYGGGTVGGALSAITTTINAVNAIYERDLSIRLMLVNNETSVIFTNSATDGFTSDDANTLLVQNQTVLDQRIGSTNYDVGMVLDGHVYAFQPGRFIFQGAAQFQSVCGSGQKGKAVAILRSTDPSTITAVYVVAHELGHMFGALHTFNGTLDDCGPSRFAQVAYEPGSGSTIMGYRGGVLPNGTYFPVCGAEELFSNDTYFHTASIEQITNYTTFGNGSFCPVTTNTQNNPPAVDAGPDYTIPANTPFTLMATASDPEADVLTYCWEEFDLGAAGPPHTDNGNRPIFRSFAPTASPTRILPQLADVLSGTSTFGESLPITSRTMTFRVTVRDNHSGGGGVNTAAMHVSVVSNAGPFAVVQPGSSTNWTAGSSQAVTWDVANTSSAPINCANVRVLLSIDGGSSFPFILAASVPNSGAATITVPNTPTSSARIKVEAVNNIFFNVSHSNFTIAPNNTDPPILLTEENSNRAVALDSVTFVRDPFNLTNANNFSTDQRTRIMLFAIGLELLPGEDLSVVTAQAEDSAHRTYSLPVESVSKLPGFSWLTQVNIRLPDGLAGDVLISISLRGAASNKAIIGIR